MFRRKYGITAQFNDPDFDMDAEVHKYWTKTGARNAYHDMERMRKYISVHNWRYIIIDLRTGEDITDELR